ncbi:MAG TPA: DUF87 domain-containing protein [Kiritimatiellia bacterium]|nr:DUF87 domain-containing protein [Kiritimatiellia bacterium]
MQNFEKLGSFYLGKEYDLAAGARTDNLLLYDAKDLTTHAMIVGMTGSGKTGLAISLLEEAAIDGIPAILIDPKGDLANLMLQFPDLTPDAFQPWVDPSEATRKGVSLADLAAATAQTWRNGLAEWGQDPSRIRRLRDGAEFVIYTPGHASVRPLQILRSFAAPPPALRSDDAALHDRVLTAVSGLLGLLGLDADPVQSRDAILLSNLFCHAWREGRDLDLAALIRDVQKPPFARVGVLDLETFYPSAERMGLVMRLNNVLASPGFSAWMEGEPLDVQRLLFSPTGKPRHAILYLAHLSDTERMFFVTLLLNEVTAWMRAQSGTGSLRALLYMDEIFGYFPPTANPPSKTPMLTLLKQARAYGLGVVLATQNPVDLDYKGLSNCGTWFIGRLQTERDKKRVIEGLEGAAASSGAGFDRARTEQLLAGLGNRLFLMRNVHEEEPVLFQTRWALSYLRGPLTLPQLATLAPPRDTIPEAQPVTQTAALSGASFPTAATPLPPAAAHPLPPDLPVFHLRPGASFSADLVYRPMAAGLVNMRFVDAKAGLDFWMNGIALAPFLDEGARAAWEECEIRRGTSSALLDPQPLPTVAFETPPVHLPGSKQLASWAKDLESHLYQTHTFELLTYPDLKLAAMPDESEGDFRARIILRLREQRDAELAKWKAAYAPKFQTLTDQIRRAEERVAREKEQAGQQKFNTALAFGATLLGAFLGRGGAPVGTVGRATTAMRSAGRIRKESGDVARASENLETLRQRLSDMQEQFDRELSALQAPVAAEALSLVKRPVRPRKSDLSVGTVGLCWVPWRKRPDGMFEPAG